MEKGRKKKREGSPFYLPSLRHAVPSLEDYKAAIIKDSVSLSLSFFLFS